MNNSPPSIIHTFEKAQFLNLYWQKRPVLIKRFFAQFDDLLDEHELAGIAQEESIDSRIVRRTHDKWDVFHGPFEQYDTYCTHHWSLLVQGVDKFVPQAADLMKQFSFIPYWRMDDLMVSFSVEGAGVGAHIDQYDVFLVQGKGKRRWRVGIPDENTSEKLPHKDLRQVGEFREVIDEICEPGDVLYIPPGWPHEGQTLFSALTYSVGFRAPDQIELSRSLTDLLYEENCVSKRYSDPQLAERAHPALVTQNEVLELKSMLLQAIENDRWERQLLKQMSEQGLDNVEEVTPWDIEEVEQCILDGGCFEPLPGLRPLFLQPTDGPFEFFVNGEQILCNAPQTTVEACFLNLLPIESTFLSNKHKVEILHTLTTLINKGYWVQMDVD